MRHILAITIAISLQACGGSPGTTGPTDISQQSTAIPEFNELLHTQACQPIATGPSPSPRIIIDGEFDDWRGNPTYIMGSSQYSNGEYVYTDFLYDSHGANIDGFHSGTPDPVNHAGLAWPNLQDPTSPRLGGSTNTGRYRVSGDFAHPRRADNTGYYNVTDISEFRMTRDEKHAYFYLRTTAMTDEGQGIFSIGLDIDRNASTGGVSWPMGANLPQQLGYDLVISVWPEGGAIHCYNGTSVVTNSFDELGIEFAVNQNENAFEIALPYPKGGDSHWKVWVVSGLFDETTQGFAEPQPDPEAEHRVATGSPLYPNIFQVLFRPYEFNTWWREGQQADDLVANDISANYAEVHMKELGSLQSEAHSGPTLSGPLNLVHISDMETGPDTPLVYGEGLTDFGGILSETELHNVYLYEWKEQPHSLLLPTDYETRAEEKLPLFMFYRSLNPNHNVYHFKVDDCLAQGRTHLSHETDRSDFEEVQKRVDEMRVMVGSTLVRGEGMGYSTSEYSLRGVGHVDVIEAYSDIKNRFAVDEDRIFFKGMSMGAGATVHLSQLYAPQVAAAAAWSGMEDISNLQNLRHVPFFLATGSQDNPAGMRDTIVAQLREMRYETLFMVFTGRAHDFNLVCDSKGVTDPFLANRKRATNPARVSYRINPTDFPTYYSDIISVPKGAYWVDFDGADPELPYTVDLINQSLAGKDIADPPLPTVVVEWSGEYNHPLPHNVEVQGLFHGSLDEFEANHPILSVGDDWSLVSETKEEIHIDNPPVANGIIGSLENVANATITAGISGPSLDDGPITLTLTSDEQTAFTLKSIGGGVNQVLIDGQPYAHWDSSSGSTTVTLSDGTHVYTLK